MALGGGDKITVQIHQPAEGLLGPPTVNVFILDSEQFHDYQEVVGGYGASFGGLAALLSMLNSCASGVATVNIDNGFGAGYLAHVINELGER